MTLIILASVGDNHVTCVHTLLGGGQRTALRRRWQTQAILLLSLLWAAVEKVTTFF
jgi:hypothetical protein